MVLGQFRGLSLESLTVENSTLDIIDSRDLQIRESLKDLSLVNSKIRGDLRVLINLDKMYSFVF